MFSKWIKENSFRDVKFDTPLISKAVDRDFWGKNNHTQLIKLAENYLDFSWPSIPVSAFIAFQKDGNRMKHEAPYFERRKAFTSLVIGEILEYKGRFIRYITNFADGSAKITKGNENIFYRFGKRTNNPRLCAFAGLIKQNEAVESSDLYARLCDIIYKNVISDTDKYIPLDKCIYPQLQASFINTNNWFYSSKGGHNNESHNHNDVGSFIVYYNSSPVLVDPGCGTYTKQTFSEDRYKIWTMQSQWHNLPVINGFGQLEGKDFKADSFTLADKTTFVSFQKAYPAESKINKLYRKINAKESVIEINDTFEFNKDKNTVEEHFITLKTPLIKDNKVIIGNEFVLDASKNVEIVLDDVTFDGDKKLINMWNSDRLYRIKFNFKAEKVFDVTFNLRRL